MHAVCSDAAAAAPGLCLRTQSGAMFQHTLCSDELEYVAPCGGDEQDWNHVVCNKCSKRLSLLSLRYHMEKHHNVSRARISQWLSYKDSNHLKNAGTTCGASRGAFHTAYMHHVRLNGDRLDNAGEDTLATMLRIASDAGTTGMFLYESQFDIGTELRLPVPDALAYVSKVNASRHSKVLAYWASILLGDMQRCVRKSAQLDSHRPLVHTLEGLIQSLVLECKRLIDVVHIGKTSAELCSNACVSVSHVLKDCEAILHICGNDVPDIDELYLE